jgi:hypothetical protein
VRKSCEENRSICTAAAAQRYGGVLRTNAFEPHQQLTLLLTFANESSENLLRRSDWIGAGCRDAGLS